MHGVGKHRRREARGAIAREVLVRSATDTKRALAQNLERATSQLLKLAITTAMVTYPFQMICLFDSFSFWWRER